MIRIGLLVVILGLGANASQAQVLAPPCAALTTAQGHPDLYCINLYPTADFDAAGHAVLQPVPSPFGVAVTPDGTHRYRLAFHLKDLPDPATLGPYTTYVAWATTPRLTPVVKLGEVGHGAAAGGEVAFNQFLVLITAEASADVAERTGRLVLRGRSPSSRMEAHDLLTLAPLAVMGGSGEAHAHHAHGEGGWAMPPMHPAIRMAPGMQGLRPGTAPYLPSPDAATLPEALPRQVHHLVDGDTLALSAYAVRRTLRGKTLVLYGFNGQYPGPLLYIPQAATIVVPFTNHTEWPTAVHWHGLRLDNRYDGVPGLTQAPVNPGETFTYHVHFPDAGLYWYHPHHREDVYQDLGLYGNLLVQPAASGYYNPVNHESVLMLDDLLLGEDGLVPYGEGSANYMMMGRFGNVFLVNGEPDYRQTVARGAVVRFFLTNVSNTRTFNLSLGGLPFKVVGTDVSRFEREVWAESVVLAPAERYIVEAHFPEAGTVALTNRVQAIDHMQGVFFPEVDTLARIDVRPTPVDTSHAEAFARLRPHVDVQADIDRHRAHFDRPVDHALTLDLAVQHLPPVVAQLMQLDAVYFNPVEWSGTMPMMNWASTGETVQWILRDDATAHENMDIHWRFKVGDVVKLRLTNNREAFHAMQHPVHIHGQRFLVLSVNGVPNDNLAWKDTVLLPAGATADLLLELTNPGRWMIHCHIAEHLASGMKMVFTVDP